MAQLAGLGELLIDFTPAGKSAQGNALYERNPGGSVCNLLVAAQRLGTETAFLGQVGDDNFGRFLRDELMRYNVDTRGLLLNARYLTTLAFVQLFDDGDRDFDFYRRGTADTQLDAKDICYSVIDEADMLHVASLMFTDEPSAGAQMKALTYAKEKGKTITYDPNWRSPLWESEAKGISMMQKPLELVDYIKVSEEELKMITGEGDLRAGAKKLLSRGLSLVVVTLGPDGSAFFCDKGNEHVKTFDNPAVDATGAGDACFGALLSGMLRVGLTKDTLEPGMLKELLAYANAVASVCVSRRGGMPSMPTPEEVRETFGLELPS